jgi:hypothetical protein
LSEFFLRIGSKLKSLKGQTKAEEFGDLVPELLGLLLPLRLFGSSRFSGKKIGQNGGTEGAPRGDGPSLKNKKKKQTVGISHHNRFVHALGQHIPTIKI